MKKIIAMLLVLVCMVTALAGCSNTKPSSSEDNTKNQSNDNKEANNNMGRYLEETIELPEFTDTNYIMEIIRNKDKQFEIYAHGAKEDGSNAFLCYRLEKDGTWKVDEVKALNNYDLKPNSSITDVRLGLDGNYYFLQQEYSDKDLKSTILRLNEADSTLVEVPIPYLTEYMKKQGKEDSYPYISDYYILENGEIILSEGYFGGDLVLISAEGEVTKEIATGQSQYFRYIPYGSQIIYPNENTTGINSYNTKTGDMKELKEISFSEDTLIATSAESGTIYTINSSGIQTLGEGGSLWEVVVDGSLNSMNMPTMIPSALFVDESEKEEFHVLYQNNQQKYFLMRYYFNPDIVSVPTKELTIYSLKENATIMQALPQFHALNSDVKINYIVAMEDDDENVSDYIRALNTELLNGNGADILILDNMPIDSYIEKGILADLSDIIKPLDTSGELNSKLLKSYYQDDKLYKLPIRYSVPLAVGLKNAVNSMESTNSIVNYIKKNSSHKFIDGITNKDLIADFLALYSEEFFVDGSLNEQEYKEFLENLKTIAGELVAVEMNTSHKWMQSRIGNLMQIPSKQDVTVLNVKSISDLMLICTFVKDKGVIYDSINDKYLPSGIIGLNNSSKEIDLAKDFIVHLLSLDVQDAEVYDGFPINNNAMKKWLERHREGSGIMVSNDDGTILEGFWPNKEEREQWGEFIKTLSTPIEINYTLNEMMINETLPLFTSNANADSIAAALKSKVNTYLAE